MPFSGLFPYYFWVTSIPLSIVFFSPCLQCFSYSTPHPALYAPPSLRCGSLSTSLRELLMMTSVYSDFFPLDSSYILFCTCSFGMTCLTSVMVYLLHMIVYLVLCAQTLIGRHQMSCCGLMWFLFMLVILSTNCWKALIIVSKVPRRLPSRAAGGTWNHPECLHQFQGKLSTGKISTPSTFCKEMTSLNILKRLRTQPQVHFLSYYTQISFMSILYCLVGFLWALGTVGTGRRPPDQELGGPPGCLALPPSAAWPQGSG